MKLKKETMSKHFIYHIFGKKIGCTNNIAIRMKQQNVKEGEYEILEEHTNAKTASDRERELQIEKGYKSNWSKNKYKNDPKFKLSQINETETIKYDKFSIGGLISIIENLKFDIDLINLFKLNDENYDNILTYEQMLEIISTLK
jgi:hypothetical protein